MRQRHTSVDIGHYRLTVWASGATLIAPRDAGKEPASLSRALHQTPSRPSPDATDDEAAAIIANTAEAAELFTALVDGSLLATAQVVPRIDQILDMLQRLDRAGRHDETLRLARAISGPLLLTQRWAELVHTLDAARRVAEHIADSSGVAWAQHELGTLHLAAGDLAAAEPRLAQAQEIRERLGERQALDATQHNLNVLCRRLREMLHEDDSGATSTSGRSLLTLILAAVLPLVLAATAYAVLVPANPHVSRLIVNVSGHGLVTSGQDGIQCRHSCRRDLNTGDAVSLTARADKGWHFTGWFGDCLGKNPCAPMIEGSTTVTATFVREDPKPPECRDGKDNDGDGAVDAKDPGCADGTETTAEVE